MNTDKNIFQILDVHFSDEKLLAFIENCDNQQLVLAKEQGKEDGFENKPQEGFSHYDFNPQIHDGYNLLLSEVKQRLDASVHLKFGKLDIDEVKRENQRLELEKDRTVEDLRQISIHPSIFSIGRIIKAIVVILLCLIIWIGEQEFIYKSLGLIGGGVFSNRLLALAITTTVLALGHYAKRWTDGIQSKLLKGLSRIATVMLLMTVFMALGILRQSYFSEAKLDVPLWVFVSVNVVFFLGFYLLSIYVLIPSLSGLKGAGMAFNRRLRKRYLIKVIRQFNEEIKNNTQRLNEDNRLRIAIVAFAKSLQDLITRKYKRAWGVYLKANLNARETPYTPSSDNPPPLDTHYNDINI